jgi:endoglucanase
MKSLIEKLVSITSPSGYEAKIRAAIREEIEPFADEIRVDGLGNLIARKGQKSEKGARIMLAAHMDEIGIIATHIDDYGFVRFAPIGGVFPRNCPGGHVKFLNGVTGVIGVERLENRSATPSLNQLFIDIGATSRENHPIRVGDVAAFDRAFVDMGDRIATKALDDRIGVAILIEVLRKLSEFEDTGSNEYYFVFSVQEEVGLRGATTATFGVDPDFGIAVDVTLSGDTPNGMKMAVGLGKGPAIKVRDSGMLASPQVVDWMVETAEEHSIPYQLEVLEGGTTDARAIQLTRMGVPAGCVSIPCRYVHSPSEVIDIHDVENAVDLLVAMLKGEIPEE